MKIYLYYAVLDVEHDANIENKKNKFFDNFLEYSKKWPFLATFGKIAISQPKLSRISRS